MSEIDKDKNEYWSSQFGLILAGIGMAVGCGNIWRFPRIAAQYGGSVFIIAWIIALFIWSLPLMILEMYIGTKTKKAPIEAFNKFLGNKFIWMGAWICTVTLIITCYYSVITGWCIKYITYYIKGEKIVNPNSLWNNFISSYQPLFFHFIGLLIGLLIVWKGIKKGIELANKIFLPLLFILMIFLAYKSLTLKGGKEGVHYLLFRFNIKDFFNPSLWREAFTQSAWSTGAGWGLWLTYANYSKIKENSSSLVSSSLIVCVGDYIASILAGLVVIPTIFATVSDIAQRNTILSSGSQGITFIHLVNLFNKFPEGSGRIIGLIFFISLFLAAMSSFISMLELGIKTIKDFGLSRNKSVLLIGCFVGILGVPSALSINFFNNQDWVWSLGLLVSGLFMAVAGIISNLDNIKSYIFENKKIQNWWKYCIKYFIPILFIILLSWWLILPMQNKWEKNIEWWNIKGIYTPLNVLLQWSILIIILLIINKFYIKNTKK